MAVGRVNVGGGKVSILSLKDNYVPFKSTLLGQTCVSFSNNYFFQKDGDGGRCKKYNAKTMELIENREFPTVYSYSNQNADIIAINDNVVALWSAGGNNRYHILNFDHENGIYSEITTVPNSTKKVMADAKNELAFIASGSVVRIVDSGGVLLSKNITWNGLYVYGAKDLNGDYYILVSYIYTAPYSSNGTRLLKLASNGDTIFDIEIDSTRSIRGLDMHGDHIILGDLKLRDGADGSILKDYSALLSIPLIDICDISVIDNVLAFLSERNFYLINLDKDEVSRKLSFSNNIAYSLFLQNIMPTSDYIGIHLSGGLVILIKG